MIGKNKIRIQITIKKNTLKELDKCNKLTQLKYPNYTPSTRSQYIEVAIKEFNKIILEREKND